MPEGAKQNINHETQTKFSLKSQVTKLLNANKTNKFLYDIQIKKTCTDIKQKQKWETMLNTESDIDWKACYTLSFETTVDNKLRNFNYKFLMGIVRTNKDLFKFKLVNSSLCDFCGQSPEDIYHLFWGCHYSQIFWVSLANILSTCNIDVDINFANIALGIPALKQNKTPINYSLLLAKYYLFRCKCRQERLVYNHFKDYLKEKINVEKHIAIRKGKLDLHNAKWSNFSQIYN